MAEELIQVKVTPLLKLLMLLTILACLGASWFVVRWYLGNTIAENLITDQRQLAIAEMAARMAPNDPLTHWRLGSLIETQLHSDQISRAVSEYDQAVSLAPHDYRLWMDLGAALEQAGESERAEKALRTAVKLAPSYSEPRWRLGNLLLRTGRYDEAFTELQRASDANDKLQPQLFNLAWQVNKNDFESLKTSIGNSPNARAQFSQYLVARGRFEEGLRLWDGLSSEEKKMNRPAADSIISSLIAVKRYHQAVGVLGSVTSEQSYGPQLGQVSDPGFEASVVNDNPFGWQITSSAEVHTAVDNSEQHTGDRSLRLVFQVRNKLEAINVSQLVPVSPNTQYDFECFYKTQKLVSAATPITVISDAADDAIFATSEPLPNGSNDWQRLAVSFKTGPKTEALRLRINRVRCEEDSPVCPIYGTVWYDDFNLKARK